MTNLFKYLDVITEKISCFFLLCATAAIFLQVVYRYLLFDALTWPEEVARFCFIWCTYGGISICMKSDRHLRMEALTTFLPISTQKSLNLICMFINTAFFLILFCMGVDMTMKVHSLDQYPLSFDFPPLWVVWIGIPLFCLLTALQAARHFFILLKK